MKILNVKGIIILIAILLSVHLVFGLVISPFVGKVVLDVINKNSDAKIEAERISVWPLTLSASLSHLKVFDPDDPKVKMVGVRKASIRLSLIGLLRKRIAISSIVVAGADVNLRSEPDGSFNIQKIAGGTEEKKPAPSLLDRFKGKKDWFSMVYNMVKKRSQKAAKEKEDQKDKKKPEKITREVQELPRGRLVKFTPVRGGYLVQIGSLVVKNAQIHVEADGGQKVDVKKANVVLKGMGIDPKKGARFDRLSLGGRLEKGGERAGVFSIAYAQKGAKTTANVIADDIDLTAVAFVYQDSLPITVNKGILSLNSKTTIVDDKLDSKNTLVLTGQELQAQGGLSRISIGAATMPLICQALNQIDPVRLSFNITGTPENPKFTGFQDSLMKLVKPYLQEGLKKEGEGLLKGLIKKDTGGGSTEGGTATQDAVDSIKSLFKK